MNISRLEEILQNFPNEKIAVVGDFFLDKWLTIDRELDEISIETNLVAYQVVSKRIFAGAAGTVLANLAALEIGQLYAIGFVGDDGEGFELIKDLSRKNVNTSYLIKSDKVMTPTYTKPMFSMGGKETETNRLDFKNTKKTPAELEDFIIESMWQAAKKVKAIIALDQLVDEGYGVLTPRVRQALAEIAEKHSDLIVYADSRAHINKFKNAIVKCNDLEVMKIAGDTSGKKQDLDTVKQSALELSKKTGKKVFVTCGEKGVLAMTDAGEVNLVETIPQTGEIDIVGAGDACTAGIVSSLCSGATAEEAAFIGNLASSITIQVIGTTGTASREQIMQRFKTCYNKGAV